MIDCRVPPLLWDHRSAPGAVSSVSLFLLPRRPAVFNGDMLGWTLPGTPISLGMKDRFVSEWLLSVADLITEVYVPQLTVARSASCCSDHQSFTEAGFPAIGYFENAGGASDYPHYHSETVRLRGRSAEQEFRPEDEAVGLCGAVLSSPACSGARDSPRSARTPLPPPPPRTCRSTSTTSR